MTACEGPRCAVRPVYLGGVLTVEAGLSAGRLHDGSAHPQNTARGAVALVFAGGAPMLFTEDGSGQLTRLRVRGAGFLRPARRARGAMPTVGTDQETPARREPGVHVPYSVLSVTVLCDIAVTLGALYLLPVLIGLVRRAPGSRLR
jgi:hypothetical protein